jgi:uncharacterized membrane protein YhdT
MEKNLGAKAGMGGSMRSEKACEKMAELTKRYAAYGAERGGLVALCGGLLLVGISALGTWWSSDVVALNLSAWRAFYGNPDGRGDILLPLWLRFTAWVMPFLFLAVSAWLRHRLYMGFGRVKALEVKQPTPNIRIYWGGFLAIVLAILIAMGFGAFKGGNAAGLRLLGECCVGAGFVGAVRVRQPRGDEMALLLLLWGNAGFSFAGTIWLWVPSSWLMALFGLILAIRGLFQHRAFLELRRELEALDPPEAADV